MSAASDILILGLGRSGRAAARYAAALAARGDAGSVTAVDGGDTDELRAEGEELERLGVSVMLGAEKVEGAYDLCVASPGIAPETPIMRSASRASARTISEIEFAFEK